jgi:hypothetical protein
METRLPRSPVPEAACAAPVVRSTPGRPTGVKYNVDEALKAAFAAWTWPLHVADAPALIEQGV